MADDEVQAPPARFRCNKARMTLTVRITLHHVGAAHINLKTSRTRIQLDTLASRRKFKLDKPYPRGIECDDKQSTAKLEGSTLVVEMPITKLPDVDLTPVPTRAEKAAAAAAAAAKPKKKRPAEGEAGSSAAGGKRKKSKSAEAEAAEAELAEAEAAADEAAEKAAVGSLDEQIAALQTLKAQGDTAASSAAPPSVPKSAFKKLKGKNESEAEKWQAAIDDGSAFDLDTPSLLTPAMIIEKNAE